MGAGNLKKKIAALPHEPGVYLFKDAQGKIIYIGKAKSLKKRAASYFNRPLDTKTQVLVAKIADIEYRLAPSESQAQITEAALIREYQPQYNIDLKDDKSFPLIRITREDFPIVSICRRRKRLKEDTALYFGPYTNVKLLRQALKVMRRVFGFRSCRNMPEQACLYYRIKLCPAPCIKKISKKRYREIINQIEMFLEGKYEELINKISSKMQEAAAKKRFEEAAQIRDQLNALGAIRGTRSASSTLDELEDLKELLHLSKMPLKIEAFDISNIFGKEASGSMVTFSKGLPDKNNYRRFRIKTVAGIDDYRMLSEVILRRYWRLIREKSALPDLVLIDGGKSHLLTAERAIKKLGISLPLVSIAKEKENLYTKGRINPVRLDSDTPALNLIRRIRDEAHRFAVSYHHILRKKKILGR